MVKSPEEEHPVKAYGWASRDTSGVLSPFKFSRRATGDEDVQFKLLYCGICRSNLHCVKNEWGVSKYPLLPGYSVVHPGFPHRRPPHLPDGDLHVPSLFIDEYTASSSRSYTFV